MHQIRLSLTSSEFNRENITQIAWFHSIFVSVVRIAFSAPCVSYIACISMYLTLYRIHLQSFFFVPHRPNIRWLCLVAYPQWLRSTKSATSPHAGTNCTTNDTDLWVNSPRIPLLFVSLASTVDHHNHVCVSFFGIFSPDFACVYLIQIARTILIIVCKIYRFFSSFY